MVVGRNERQGRHRDSVCASTCREFHDDRCSWLVGFCAGWAGLAGRAAGRGHDVQYDADVWCDMLNGSYVPHHMVLLLHLLARVRDVPMSGSEVPPYPTNRTISNQLFPGSHSTSLNNLQFHPSLLL